MPPAGPASSDDAATEWKWIEATLNKSTADWLFVAGHYPGQLTLCSSHC